MVKASHGVADLQDLRNKTVVFRFLICGILMLLFCILAGRGGEEEARHGVGMAGSGGWWRGLARLVLGRCTSWPLLASVFFLPWRKKIGTLIATLRNKRLRLILDGSAAPFFIPAGRGGEGEEDEGGCVLHRGCGRLPNHRAHRSVVWMATSILGCRGSLLARRNGVLSTSQVEAPSNPSSALLSGFSPSGSSPAARRWPALWDSSSVESTKDLIAFLFLSQGPSCLFPGLLCNLVFTCGPVYFLYPPL